MTDGLNTLVGAYVLDALSSVETERFERHLRGCPDCAREVGGLRDTAAQLGQLADRPAPAPLRAAVLSGISAVQPHPAHPPLHRLIRAQAWPWQARCWCCSADSLP